MTAPFCAITLVSHAASGRVLVCDQGLSFWGGVDPDTGRIVDAHHPQHGADLSGRIVLMPSSRGSCSGSGVILQLARQGRAPAALVFCETEEILTLGAMIAAHLFERPLAILRLPRVLYEALSKAQTAQITEESLQFDDQVHKLRALDLSDLALDAEDRSMLAGHKGPALQVAMQVICRTAAAQGADRLISVSRGHIDGCILAHDANLDFAEKMLEMGAKMRVPTTINAISVDRDNWQTQGVVPDFGDKASRLADAYVAMGARPTFTCAPYLLDNPPAQDEAIGWSESNAVIYANSVLGARTQKHPDYLDLFVAMTGRAPLAGVYLETNRQPECTVHVTPPQGFDDSLWPLLGWLAGTYAPNAVPVLTGLEDTPATPDDLKALCAAFGTTSAAPLLHLRGHTPEGHWQAPVGAPHHDIGKRELAAVWHELNTGGADVDLVAIGSPHASFDECRALADMLEGAHCAPHTRTIVTLGRAVLNAIRAAGIHDRLTGAGVVLISDLCWCSMTEPVFPPMARVLMTNSGKYAHYANGLTGRKVRFGGLRACAGAALTGRATVHLPDWLATKS